MSARVARVHVAPAKVNLTLEVVARRPDGYHEIRSVMLRLGRLADRLRIRIDEAGDGIRIETGLPSIPSDASNLCWVAAKRYLERIGGNAGVDIQLDKAIPVAAGLGGGSSDAATVLLAMNRHFGDAVPMRDLAEIAAKIGKDVPFFLAGAAACLARGAGDIVRPLQSRLRGRVLVVDPGVHVATGEAYAALAAHLRFMNDDTRSNRSAAMVRAIASGDVDAVAAALYNDFEVLVERWHPLVREIRQALLAFGARGAAMSGSGPTTFGLFASANALARAEAGITRHFPSLVVKRG